MKIKSLTLFSILLFLLAACGGATEVVETKEATDPSAPTATTEAEIVDPKPAEEEPQQDMADANPQFVIQPEASEARFYIDEVLRGEPKTVEGITQQVAGGVLIESLDPLSVTIQTVEIQSGGFVTDSNFRNRAISDAILQAGRFPAIVFTPTSIEGLPARGEPGETYTFEVTGDLMIRDIPQTVTFQVSLTADSADVISGTASTTINRTDYGLSIPSVPQVADVSEEVILEFDFSAVRAN
jgi:polyisoprenoid-binding protein YceI